MKVVVVQETKEETYLQFYKVMTILTLLYGYMRRQSMKWKDIEKAPSNRIEQQNGNDRNKSLQHVKRMVDDMSPNQILFYKVKIFWKTKENMVIPC